MSGERAGAAQRYPADVLCQQHAGGLLEWRRQRTYVGVGARAEFAILFWSRVVCEGWYWGRHGRDFLHGGDQVTAMPARTGAVLPPLARLQVRSTGEAVEGSPVDSRSGPQSRGCANLPLQR